MSNPLLLKSFSAGAALTAFRFVKLSAAETVVLAAAATDSIVGLTNEVAAASGERQDVIVSGIGLAEAGAAVSLGALLTSDASGRAVAAAPAAGSNSRIGAIALESASAAGDVIRALVQLGSVQG